MSSERNSNGNILAGGVANNPKPYRGEHDLAEGGARTPKPYLCGWSSGEGALAKGRVVSPMHHAEVDKTAAETRLQTEAPVSNTRRFAGGSPASGIRGLRRRFEAQGWQLAGKFKPATKHTFFLHLESDLCAALKPCNAKVVQC